jgi:hypothetical protein
MVSLLSSQEAGRQRRWRLLAAKTVKVLDKKD